MFNNMTHYDGLDTKKDTKCGLNMDSEGFILSKSVDCHHSKGFTDVQPKDKATL